MLNIKDGHTFCKYTYCMSVDYIGVGTPEKAIFLLIGRLLELKKQKK